MQRRLLLAFVLTALWHSSGSQDTGACTLDPGADYKVYFYYSPENVALPDEVLLAEPGAAWSPRDPGSEGPFPYECMAKPGYCQESISVSFMIEVPTFSDTPSRQGTRYIIDTGCGPHSRDGYYLALVDGLRYELGVCEAGSLYSLSFLLDTAAPEKALHVLFSYQRGAGASTDGTGGELTLYVNGLFVAHSAEAQTRLFFNNPYDQFTTLTYGVSSSDPRLITGDTSELGDIVINTIKIYQDKTPSTHHVKEIDTLPSSYQEGCVADIEPGEAFNALSRCDCRQKCFNQKVHHAIWNSESGSCACRPEIETIIGPPDCTTMAYFTSHVTEELPFSCELTCELKYLNPAKGFARPEEGIVVECTLETDEVKTYTYQWGDGAGDHLTEDTAASHLYAVGEYTVTVAADSRHCHQQWTASVTVQEESDDVAPTVLFSPYSEMTDPVGTVQFYMAAFSTLPAQCELDLGDGSPNEHYTIDPAVVPVLEASHTYVYSTGVGVYPASFKCSNDAGETTLHEPAIVVDTQTESVVTDMGLAVDMDVACDPALLRLTADGVPVPAEIFEFSGTALSFMPVEVLSSPGQHLVEVIAEWEGYSRLLRSMLLDARRPITSIDFGFVADYAAAPDEPLTFFVATDGDLVHAKISWDDRGDGNDQYFYIPGHGDGAVTSFEVQKAFPDLGPKHITLQVDNNVGGMSTSITAYIQRQVAAVSNVTAADIIDPATENVTFTFHDVDPGVVPALPINVLMDYGDGTTENVWLGTYDADSDQPTRELIHQYVTSGDYKVTAMIQASQMKDRTQPTIILDTTVRVGQEIQLIDLQTVNQTTRFAVGESVDFVVSVPYGRPINVQVYTGELDENSDEIVLVFAEPDGYEGVFVLPTEEPLTDGSGEEDTLVADGEGAAEARKRRAAGDGVAETTVTPEEELDEDLLIGVEEAVSSGEDDPAIAVPAPGKTGIREDIVLSHTYTTPGEKRVKATVENVWGKHATVLCPGLLIVENAVPECDAFDAAFVEAHTEESPLETPRSANVSLPFTATIDCAKSSDYEAVCDWKLFKWDVAYGMYRPENEICAGDQPGPLEIPGNTLWYGTYRIECHPYLRVLDKGGNPAETGNSGKTKRAAPDTLSSGATLLGIAPLTTYVKVKSTPLVALFKDPPVIVGFDEETNSYVYNATSLILTEATPSHDPDVPATNKTAMEMYFFLYRDAKLDGLDVAGFKQITTYLGSSPGNIPKTHFYYVAETLNGENNCLEDVEIIRGVNEIPAECTDLVLLRQMMCIVKDEREDCADAPRLIKKNLIEEGANLDAMTGEMWNLLESGDILGCLSMLTANSASTDISDDEETSEDEADKLDAAKKEWLEITARAATMAESTDVVGKACKTTTALANNPKQMSGEAKTFAANSLKSASTRNLEVDLTATPEEVAATGKNMLKGIGKVQPGNGNQKKRKVVTPEYEVPVEEKLRFSHDPSEPEPETEEEKVERLRLERLDSCCLAPEERSKQDFVGEWIPQKSFCAWIEDENSKRTNYSRCAYYWIKVFMNKANLTENETDAIVEQCRDQNSEIYDDLGLKIYLFEYEPKYEVYPNDEVCDLVDVDIRQEEYEHRYIVWATLEQKADYNERKKTMGVVEEAGGGMADSVLKKTSKGGDTQIGDENLSLDVVAFDGENDHPRLRRSADGKHLVDKDGTAYPGDILKNAGAMTKMKSKDNPYTFSSTKDGETPADQLIKSPTLDLKMKNKDGSPMVVENSNEPFRIVIGRTADQISSIPVHERIILDETDGNDEMVALPNKNSSVLVRLVPKDDDDIYVIYARYDNNTNPNPLKPSKDEHDYSVELPNEDREGEARYQTLLPQWLTERNGTVRLRMELIKFSITVGQATQRNYTVTLLITSCAFWNKTLTKWDNRGCAISNDTSLTETVCDCNHLTTFGGDFVVPPNTIDFSTVFSTEKFLESMPVFCTVIILILIYVSGLVWARREDKKDLIKWGATPMEDNLPTDNYHYQITVNTGVRKKAGTKSRVSFILSGDDSDTGVRRLFDGKRKELPAGSIYNYVLSTEQCLGPMTYLRIWHDNTGKGIDKGWYLDQIQITDLQNGDRFFFLCDKWLAVEEDDGMVERILPVAGLSDLSAFKHLFSSSVRKKLTNDHMWFSVVSRPTRSNFTRVQRISCCISLLFLTMITNCMFFKSDEGATNVAAVKIGPFSFTLHQLFISIVTTLIVFPPSLAIVTIFRKAKAKKTSIMQMNQSLSQKSKKFRWRTLNPGSSLWDNKEKTRMQKFKDGVRNTFTFNSKQKYEADPDEQRQVATGTKKKKKGWSLPHWTMYIAWTMVFFSVVASGFFTILYSMEWGRDKSLDWLSTFVLSFFQSVIVVQPVKVLLLAAFISCIMRKPELDNEEDDFDDAQGPSAAQSNLSSSQRNLQEIIKQRSMAAEEVKPPDTASLEIARKKRLQEIQMSAILKECIVYFFFIAVLFFLSYQARDPDSFTFAQNIKSQFLDNSPNFDAVSKPDSFWQWCYRVLLPNMYSSEWYNGKLLDWREALQVGDRNTIRIGVGRIRQLRIKEDSCDIQEPFQSMITHCRDYYNWLDDDTGDYLPAWEKPQEGREDEVHLDTRSAWVYRNSVELKNPPYAGLLTMYKGGGYTFSFRRSKDKTERLMRVLEQQEWIGVKSRAVFVEYTLYNANVNLFGSVIMLIEFMATGAAISKTEVKVFRLNSYVGGFGIIVIFMEVVYLGFTLYFFGKMCKDLKKLKLKYFKDFWNMLEFATLILSLIAIIMYAMKKVFGTVAMNVLHDSGNRDYVNFITISIWDEMFGFILAMVVFLATLKFIKMLRFNKRMGMLGDTIRVAARDLKYFMITFFIYFTAFCMWAYLMFGSKLPSYGSIIGSAEALFAFALGSFDFYEFQDAHRILGPFFFFLYVGIVYIGLMGMFLTIIYDAFASVKADAELRSNDYEIVDFMMKKFKGVFGWGGSSEASA